MSAPTHRAHEAAQRATGEKDGDVSELLATLERRELKYVLSYLFTDDADTDLLYGGGQANVTADEMNAWIEGASE